MFRQSEVPVLGLIENMSDFVCPSCGKTSAPFGEGAGERRAAEFDVPFLGDIPLDASIRACADAGTPIVDALPDSPASRALNDAAGQLLESLGAGS